MKRLVERAVAATTDGEILNVHLSATDRAMSAQTLPFPDHVLRLRCRTHEPHTAARDASLLTDVLKRFVMHAGGLDTYALVCEVYRNQLR